jgi:hypothetical protein
LPSARSLPREIGSDGKIKALAEEAIFGIKPCWWHCLQKLAQSGPISAPVTISTFSLGISEELDQDIMRLVLNPNPSVFFWTTKAR